MTCFSDSKHQGAKKKRLGFGTLVRKCAFPVLHLWALGRHRPSLLLRVRVLPRRYGSSEAGSCWVTTVRPHSSAISWPPSLKWLPGPLLAFFPRDRGAAGADFLWLCSSLLSVSFSLYFSLFSAPAGPWFSDHRGGSGVECGGHLVGCWSDEMRDYWLGIKVVAAVAVEHGHMSLLLWFQKAWDFFFFLQPPWCTRGLSCKPYWHPVFHQGAWF